MNFRTLFWSLAFALPVVAGAALSVSLQHEHAALRTKISQLTALLHQQRASLAEAAGQAKDFSAQKAQLEASIKQLSLGLSRTQRRNLAVQLAAGRLAASGGTNAKNSPLSIIQRSPTQPYFIELLGDPKYAKAVAALLKQQVEGDYGRLLASLNLGPEQKDKLEDLWAERYMVRLDTDSLLGTGPVDGRHKAMSLTGTSINKEILATFGPAVDQQWRAYEPNLQFYATMDDMASRLSYSPAPLASAQEDQLVGMLSQTVGNVKGRAVWTIPDGVMTQAQEFLAPAQLQVLQQIREEQQVRVDAKARVLSR